MLAGAAAGFLGACFHWLLERADRLRNEVIDSAYGSPFMGLLMVVALTAGASALAAWLVRRFSPAASGSGIPNVEAVLSEKIKRPGYILLPVKFVGGLLALGAGQALGREGPTIQIGAIISQFVGTFFRLSAADARILLAAGAGAGLATAFNAPISGCVFVLEELLRRFDTRITISTLGASASAIVVSRALLGNQPNFPLQAIPFPTLPTLLLLALFGLLVGLLGVAYNRAIVGALAAANRMTRLSVEVRAGVVGAAVGLLAWFLPQCVGGGDNLTQQRSTAPSRWAFCRRCSPCDLRWAPSRMPPERLAVCSRRSSCWALRRACFLALTPRNGVRNWVPTQECSPSPAWLHFSRPSSGRPSPASFSSPS